MRKLKIRFYIEEINHQIHQQIEEILDMTPLGSTSWYEVRDSVGIKGEGESVESAVFRYLRKKIASPGGVDIEHRKGKRL